MSEKLKVRVYVVITIQNYIPEVMKVVADKEFAISEAKKYAGDWANQHVQESGEVYFNQESEGDMSEAVSVQEADLEVEL